MATHLHPSNSPAGVVPEHTASMPTAPVGCFDSQHLHDVENVPLVEGGQGRAAPDTDLLFTIVLAMLYGMFLGALCGSMGMWLALVDGGGQ